MTCSGQGPRVLMLLTLCATIGCADSPLTTPTSSSTRSSGVASSADATMGRTAERPFKGDCQTTVAPVDPANAGVCEVFAQAPSAFAEINGTCQLTHLGRSTTHTVQQLLFALDPQGQPVLVNGQPIIAALRNCATFTAANGDTLRHTTAGTVAPGAAPGTVTFSGELVFTGGSGRFADAAGVATFEGDASLSTNTGRLAIDGRLTY